MVFGCWHKYCNSGEGHQAQARVEEANGHEMAERGLDFSNGLYSTICKFISGDRGEWGI